MSKYAKKIFVTALAAVVALSVMAPAGSAQAQTVEELTALIAALQTQINDLLAQVATLGGTPITGGGVTGIPAGFTFEQNLAQGMSNQDVMYLQIFLNSDSDTQLASSGAGSPGNETQYFGPITHAGAVKYQEKFTSEILTPVGLTSGTGFVGPSTRAQLNSMLAAAPSPPPPGTPPPP